MNCLICRSPIQPEEDLTQCDHCSNEFHLECWNENGGCGTTGCPNVPTVKKQLGTSTKVCPACGEKIRLDDLVCPYCNERFDTIAPVTVDELKNRYTKERPVINERKGAIAVLIFGLLGITAPFDLIFGGIWYYQNRKILKETSPLHNILSVVGLSVSVFYSIMILVGILAQ